ncbi:hypothetical protein L7F22_022966 [Adiantum nelumboides]|nr:hypothetical protein [Adiantum nelumboides]
MEEGLKNTLHWLNLWHMGIMWIAAICFSYFRLFSEKLSGTQAPISHPASVVTGSTRPACIITGASSGIGKATAEALALKGYYVILGKGVFEVLAKQPKMQALLQGTTQVVSSLPFEKEDSHAKGSHDTCGKDPTVERQQVVKTPSRASGLKDFGHDTVNDDKEKAHAVEQSLVLIGHRQPSTHGLVNGQDSNQQVMRHTIQCLLQMLAVLEVVQCFRP